MGHTHCLAVAFLGERVDRRSIEVGQGVFPKMAEARDSAQEVAMASTLAWAQRRVEPSLHDGLDGPRYVESS